MIFYLTVNEFYSGIYQGQVIDVVSFFKNSLHTETRLVAFIPLKGFWKRREEIRSMMPDAIILPMFPKQSTGKMWKQSRFLLFLFCRMYKCKAIMARNPMAGWLAISAREQGAVKKVCYDGRGAVSAEASEYNIYPKALAEQMSEIESLAVLQSDQRVCITTYLFEYWKREFGYKGNAHLVIPGTLNNNFIDLKSGAPERIGERKKHGYSEEDILLIYAGSTEGWQSFKMLYGFLKSQFEKNVHVKVLFLSKDEENIRKLAAEFPANVKRLWLLPSEVGRIMCMGDYGLIIRESSVTNEVAFPTKFPEYLACGLNVLVNDSVKEIADFIRKNDCGFVIDEIPDVQMKRSSGEVAVRNRELALTHFNKHSERIRSKYVQLIEALN